MRSAPIVRNGMALVITGVWPLSNPSTIPNRQSANNPQSTTANRQINPQSAINESAV